EDEGHLEEDLELGGDRLGAALVEALGAVAALEHEGFAARGARELGAELLDLPGGDERRQAPDLVDDAREGGLVGIADLLLGGLGGPAARRPCGHVGRCGAHGARSWGPREAGHAVRRPDAGFAAFMALSPFPLGSSRTRAVGCLRNRVGARWARTGARGRARPWACPSSCAARR